MSYLEQSTRYVPYTDRPNGRWKYVVPTELTAVSVTESLQFNLQGNAGQGI